MKKLLTKFAGFAAVFVLFLVLMPTGVFADHTVNLGTLTNNLHLQTGGNYSIDGGSTWHPYTGTMIITGYSSTNTIVVESGEHDINLYNMEINVSSNDDACAFDIQGTATANIFLFGSNTLSSGKPKPGLQVAKDATLNIKTSTDSAGELTANGGLGDSTTAGGTGIGGTARNQPGTITISGGSVIANGGHDSSGIGSGANSEGGTINISGGTVKATGGNRAAGIGGGLNGGSGGLTGAGGNITISGGEVTAIGGSNAAGIGGGSFGAGGTITISGGKVTATGNLGGAAIGGGGSGAGGNITILGGEVIATGGHTGAGIGGGNEATVGSTITISGGMVTATGGHGDPEAVDSHGDAIGAGGHSYAGGTFTTTYTPTGGGTPVIGNAFIITNSNNSGVAIADTSGKTSGWSGIIFENADGSVYGTQALKTDAEIPSGKTLTIAAGNTLTIDAGVTLTNNGTFINDGTLTGTGTLDGGGSFKTNVLKTEYISRVQNSYPHTGSDIMVTPRISDPIIWGNEFIVNTYSKSLQKEGANNTWSNVSEVKDIGNYRFLYERAGYPNVAKTFKVVGTPNITAGAQQTVARGQSAIFVSDADFVDYNATDITLSGAAAPQKIHTAGPDNQNVSVQSGSIRITLSSAYTATLPLGTHTISINSIGGSATTTFTVTEQTTSTNTTVTEQTAATTTYNPAISPLTGVYSK